MCGDSYSVWSKEADKLHEALEMKTGTVGLSEILDRYQDADYTVLDLTNDVEYAKVEEPERIEEYQANLNDALAARNESLAVLRAYFTV